MLRNMKTEPQSFRELIDLWGGVPSFRKDMGLAYVTAQKMYQRNSIAATHWQKLIELAPQRDIEIDPATLVRLKSSGAAS